MMWGCISGEGVGPVVRVEGRLNGDGYLHLLSRQLLPHAQALSPGFIVMDDNAPCHRARKVRTWTTDHLYGGVATSESGFKSD